MERKIPLLACLLDFFFLARRARSSLHLFLAALLFSLKNFIGLLLFSLSLLALLPLHGLRSDDHVFGYFL
jgi:predicted membrane protein